MDFFQRMIVYCFHAVIYEKYFKEEAILDSRVLSDCQTILRGRFRTFMVIFYGIGSLLIEIMYMRKFRGKWCALFRTACYALVLCVWETLLTWTLKVSGSCPEDYVKREFDWDQLLTLHLPFCFALCFYLEFLVCYVHSVDLSVVKISKDAFREIKNMYNKCITSNINKNGNIINNA